jgi:hypothetical protein
MTTAAHEDFRLEATETPVPLGVRIGESLKAEFDVFQSISKFADSRFVPGDVEFFLCSRRTRAAGGGDEDYGTKEKNNYQGWPLVFVPLPVPVPLVVEPKSKRSMVRVFSPCFTRSSPR